MCYAIDYLEALSPPGHPLIMADLCPLQAFMQQQQTPEGAKGHAVHGAPMPTRSELLAAGQQHLVRAIQHAGGFLTVAQVCFGLPSAHVQVSRC